MYCANTRALPHIIASFLALQPPLSPILQVRRALLEADVSLPVVRRFIKKVEERALGTKVREERVSECARRGARDGNKMEERVREAWGIGAGVEMVEGKLSTARRPGKQGGG